MDVGYLLGGLLIFAAPPIISVIARKVRKKPSIKNPIWQYIITLFIMSVIVISGSNGELTSIILLGILIYAYCYYIDYSMYRQVRKDKQLIIKDEIKYLDFDNSDMVMKFAQAHPESVAELNKLLELHEKLKKQ